MIWAAAGVAALAFFAAILLHELAHAAVAARSRREGPFDPLFALGGMAQISRDTTDARTEFWMSLAGPRRVCSSVSWRSAAPGSWAGPTTRRLAGHGDARMVQLHQHHAGRLQHDFWFPARWRPCPARDYLVVDRHQVRRREWPTLGQVVAFGFIFIGFLSFISGGGFGGLWLAFIGWFLADAAPRRHSKYDGKDGSWRRVRDVISATATIERGTSASPDVAEEVLRLGRRCFFVIDGGRVAGMVTPQEVRALCRAIGGASPRPPKPCSLSSDCTMSKPTPCYRGAGYDRRSGCQPVAACSLFLSRPVASVEYCTRRE